VPEVELATELRAKIVCNASMSFIPITVTVINKPVASQPTHEQGSDGATERTAD